MAKRKLPPNAEAFTYYNAHPLRKHVGDCVVRALSVLEHETWSGIYDELCEIGSELYDMPNSMATISEYLKRHSYKKHPMPRKENGKRYTVLEFARLNPRGFYLISLTSHMVGMKDGVVYDIWNSTGRCMGNYYTKVITHI